MTDSAIQGEHRDLRVVAPLDPKAEVRTLRAFCEDCGAHTAVVTAGSSMTGRCPVCGGGRLQLMDETVPPPRRLI